MSVQLALAVCALAIQQPPPSGGTPPPEDARIAVARLFAASVSAPDERTRGELLADADRLAAAYTRAWDDPFLERQVARFRRWTIGERGRKVAADSLRRAGNE